MFRKERFQEKPHVTFEINLKQISNGDNFRDYLAFAHTVKLTMLYLLGYL